MKGLKEDQILGSGEVDELLGEKGVRGRRFLEKDVFPGFEGFAGPFVVEAIGEWVVDAVDFWVGDEGLVGWVCIRDPILLCIFLLFMMEIKWGGGGENV